MIGKSEQEQNLVQKEKGQSMSDRRNKRKE